MRTFARDTETNDLVFERFASKTSNRIVLDASVDEGRKGVGDVLDAIVKTESGELSLNTEAGIRNTQLLANGESVLPFWKNDIVVSVGECEHVNEITGFEVDYNRESHTFAYRLTVRTDYGSVTVSDGVSNPAKVVNYALTPNLGFDSVRYPDSHYDATVLNFNFVPKQPLATDPEIVIRVRKKTNAPTVTVYWMDGTRDVVTTDGDVVLKHVFSNKNASAQVHIGHGAEWLAVGPADGSVDITRETISDIARFATTISSLDHAFVGTSLRKADYSKPPNVSTESWNSAFSH